jgi:glycosyltransferase involved in cell wall biosynthesis
MKIAFVFPPMWPPHVDGSLQIWNRHVTTYLSRFCDVSLYSGIFSLEPREYVDGVHYRRFSTHWDSRLLKYSMLIRKALGIQRPLFSSDLWYPGYALRIALDLRKQGCDIAHVYNYPQFAALIKFLNPTVRVILNMHGELLTQVSFTNLNERLRTIDLVISCSEFVTRPTRTKFPRIASRCKTIPMGVSPDTFSCSRRSTSDDAGPSRLRLLYVGRVSPEKGLHVLLDAFEMIVQQYPDATLKIVGAEWILPREYLADLCLDRSIVESLASFYMDSYLQQLRRRLGPETAERVTFAGLVAHSDLPEYYANADIYVNPSFYESFGMSIIEAMAAGLPVVATRVGAVPDLISDGHNGLLVDAANPSAIADAVSSLFNNARLRNSMASAAREMVRKQFSYELICSALLQMYRDVLSSAPRSIVPKTSLEGTSV